MNVPVPLELLTGALRYIIASYSLEYKTNGITNYGIRAADFRTPIDSRHVRKRATNWPRKSRSSSRSRVESGIDVLRQVGRQANKFLVSCQAVRWPSSSGQGGTSRPETGTRLFGYAKWADVGLELLLLLLLLGHRCNHESFNFARRLSLGTSRTL